jgi:hypothetical protein
MVPFFLNFPMNNPGLFPAAFPPALNHILIQVPLTPLVPHWDPWSKTPNGIAGKAMVAGMVVSSRDCREKSAASHYALAAPARVVRG